MKNINSGSVKILSICVAIFIFSVAAVAQTNEEFIHGKWRFDGQLQDKNGKPGMAWFQEWTFGDGTFEEQGYPSLSQKGKFRVLKDEDNKLTLELYDQSGTFGTKNSNLVILVDKEGGTLKIGQNPGFKKK